MANEYLLRPIGNLIFRSRSAGADGVRQATLGDVRSVLEIEKRCYPVTMRDTKHELRRFAKTFSAGFLVCQSGGKIEGYLNSIRWKRNKLRDEWTGIASHDSDGDLLFLNSMLVNAGSRHQGIGKQLMKTILAYAEGEQIYKVIITVSPDWQDKIGFLESFGFSRTIVMEWYESETEEDEYTPAFIYEKCVTPRTEDEVALIKKYSENLEDTYKGIKPNELLSKGWHGHYQDIFDDVQPGEAILEVAFGQGLFLMKARDKGASCTGVDISRHFVDAARSRLDKNGYKDIDVFHGDMTDLQFSDHSFDRLVAVYVLCHYTKKQIPAILSGMMRVIKPHGKLDFEVMSSNSSQLDQSPEAHAYELTEGSNFSADELIQLMQELGVSRCNIRLSERLAPWSLNEDQESQQMSWLIQASL